MQETWVQSLGWEDPLRRGMATHSSILAWRIPWTEETGGLQSMGSQRVGQDWATNTFFLLSEANKTESPWLQGAHRVLGWAASGCYVATATRIHQTWTHSPWSTRMLHWALKSLSILCKIPFAPSPFWEEQVPSSVTRRRSQLETQEKQQVLSADGWQRNKTQSPTANCGGRKGRYHPRGGDSKGHWRDDLWAEMWIMGKNKPHPDTQWESQPGHTSS